jgi:hypothetical protein
MTITPQEVSLHVGCRLRWPTLARLLLLAPSGVMDWPR